MFHNEDNWPVETGVVESISVYDDGGFGVSTTEHSGFGVTAKEAKAVGTLPEAGDEIVWLGGWGRPITGIFIGGVEYRYKTYEQVEQEHKDWSANYDREKEESFYKNIQSWVARKDALDEPFRERINRFANKGFQEFWTNDGGYELFTVEQANKLYSFAVEAAGADNAVEWINTFYNMDYDKQKEAFPGLDDGHSGNTFGGMVGLAKAVARGDDI